jgi:hypothetical protein
MKVALISLSNAGARVAARLAAQWPDSDVYLHTEVTELPAARRF